MNTAPNFLAPNHAWPLGATVLITKNQLWKFLLLVMTSDSIFLIKPQHTKWLKRCHKLSNSWSMSVHTVWIAFYKQHIEPLRWRHNGRDGISNHQPHHCLLNRVFRRRSKKTSKLCVTGLCGGNSPGTGEFPAQMASNAENVSIWWRHHAFMMKPWHGNPLCITGPLWLVDSPHKGPVMQSCDVFFVY